MRFTEEVKEAIIRRSGGRCEICGVSAAQYHLHHRRPRGMGGSKQLESGSAANGILIHPHCHDKVESNRSAAIENGWLVRQGHDPAYTPLLRRGQWVTLTEDGSLFPWQADVAGQ
jgi:5-methylcytosine-specific restriction protein A